MDGLGEIDSGENGQTYGRRLNFYILLYFLILRYLDNGLASKLSPFGFL